MSAETIDAIRPRTPGEGYQPGDSYAASLNESAEASLTARGIEASADSSESKEESPQRDFQDGEKILRQNLSQLQLQPVTYPPAGPSLPEPLVPIREVPLPEERSASNPALEAIQERQQERAGIENIKTELIDAAAPTASAGSAAPVDSADSTEIAAQATADGAAEPTDSQKTEVPQSSDGYRAFATEQALQSIVLSQEGADSSGSKASSDFAGKLISLST